MKKHLFYCLMLLSLNVCAQSENDRPFRDSFTLTMPVSNEAYYKSHIQSSPFVVGPKILQLFPGETILLEVEEQNGIIKNIKTVKENKNPERTVEIKFVQVVEGDKHSTMMLKVKNPFRRNFMYNAMIRMMTTGKWEETSIMPVHAGLMGIEMWPDVIISIALDEWRFV